MKQHGENLVEVTEKVEEADADEFQNPMQSDLYRSTDYNEILTYYSELLARIEIELLPRRYRALAMEYLEKGCTPTDVLEIVKTAQREID